MAVPQGIGRDQAYQISHGLYGSPNCHVHSLHYSCLHSWVPVLCSVTGISGIYTWCCSLTSIPSMLSFWRVCVCPTWGRLDALLLLRVPVKRKAFRLIIGGAKFTNNWLEQAVARQYADAKSMKGKQLKMLRENAVLKRIDVCKRVCACWMQESRE